MTTLIGVFEHDTPEWHAARAQGIGSSEIAAVLGLSPWESPFSLWHRKAEHLPPVEQNTAMEWGHRLEDPIAGKYQDAHPDVLVTKTGTWCHQDRPWQLCNPDRLLMDEEWNTVGILECKFALWSGDEWGPSGTDQIPPGYRCQVVWQGDTLGMSEVTVAALIGGFDYREFIVRWEPDEAVMLREAAREFLDSIETGHAPPLDGHDQTYQAVRDLNPHIDGSEADLPLDLAREFIRAKCAVDAAKEHDRHITSTVADHMGEAQHAACGAHRIASRVSKQGGVPYVQAARGAKKLDPDMLTDNTEGF